MQMTQENVVYCHCGAVSLRMAEAPRVPINCHCGLCRKLSGSAFTTWVTAKTGGVIIDGESALSTYQPTENLYRIFCKCCGTHIATKDKRHPGILGVPAGLLENLDVPMPKGEYFVSHKARWFSISSGLPCFGGESGFEPIPTSPEASLRPGMSE